MEPGRQENRNCVLFIIILKASITPERELAFKHLIKYYKEEEGRTTGKEKRIRKGSPYSRSTALCKITGVMSHIQKFQGARCRGGTLDVLSTIVPYLHLDPDSAS